MQMLHFHHLYQRCCSWLLWHMPVLGMSLRKVTSLGPNLTSVTDLKKIETPHILCCDLGGYKTDTTCWSGCRVQVWAQVWALLVIWQSLWRLFQKVIEGLEGKINCQALGAALLLCLRWSDRQAQTQGVSESAVVAAASNRLAWGKCVTNLTILTQFKSQRGCNAL